MSDEVLIEVEVEADLWLEALPQAEGLVRRAAIAALAGAEETGEVTVLLTDDAEMRELNRQYRKKDKATNVLSFPAPEFARPHLGDVALGFETCAREAEEQGKSLADHLSHLVAHGALHLVGYDHEDEADAEAMEALERRVLAGIGVADPYASEGNDAQLRRPE